MILNDDYLTAKQAARYLNTTTGNLSSIRYLKTGPKFVKIGRCVLYSKWELEVWEARVKARETRAKVRREMKKRKLT